MLLTKMRPQPWLCTCYCMACRRRSDDKLMPRGLSRHTDRHGVTNQTWLGVQSSHELLHVSSLSHLQLFARNPGCWGTDQLLCHSTSVAKTHHLPQNSFVAKVSSHVVKVDSKPLKVATCTVKKARLRRTIAGFHLANEQGTSILVSHSADKMYNPSPAQYGQDPMHPGAYVQYGQPQQHMQMAPAGPQQPPIPQELAMWFQSIDADRNGELDAKEIQRALGMGNLHFSTSGENLKHMWCTWVNTFT